MNDFDILIQQCDIMSATEFISGSKRIKAYHRLTRLRPKIRERSMELPSRNITLRELQEYIKSKDHKPGLELGYFMKLVEEIGELAEIIRKNKRLGNDDDIKDTIDEELYDVLYYVLALANLYNVDLERSCLLKEEINKKRTDL